MFGSGTTWFRQMGYLLALVAVAAGLLVAAGPGAAVPPPIAVSSPSIAEGDSGTKTLTFTITLGDPAPPGGLDVTYATVNGSASTADSDYVAVPSTTFTIPKDATSFDVVVTVNGDRKFEPDEAFTLDVTSSVGIADGTGTITNDDPQPTISIADPPTITEGDSGTKPLGFAVTLSNPSYQTVQVGWSTQSGTAIAGSDFQATGGTLTFAPGQTSPNANPSVNVIGDTIAEPGGPETFQVALSGPANATLADPVATGTIADNDALPTMSIADITVSEAIGIAHLTITLNGPAPAGDVTVQAVPTNGTAITGDDFGGGTVSVTILAGQTSGDVPIAILDDSLDENSEQFTVTLLNPTNATIADGTATVTITDNDNNSRISVGNATVTEPPNGSTAPATFTVSLAQASARTVTVNYATADGSGPNGAKQPGDYAAASGTLTFTPGQTSKQVPVTVNGDAIPENNETFQLNLSGAAGAPILDGSGLGTIIEPSAPPALSIGDVTVAESTGLATLTVKISRPPDATVSVNVNTADGTAKQPADYTALTSASVSWAAGDGSDKTVTVPIAKDGVDENTETFTASLANESPGTQVTQRTATVTITDSDQSSALSITSTTVTEPANAAPPVNATFTVTLLPVSERTVSVPYSVTGVEATAGADFTASSGTLTFTPGQTSKTIAVPVLGDAVYDTNETFKVTLGAPSGAKLGTPAVGIGTIVDAAAPPALSIADATLSEGVGKAIVTVSLTGNATQGTVTVNYKTVNGSGFLGATAPADFTATTGTLTFAPGTTTKTISIPIIDDPVAESDESFTVVLDTPAGATLARATATVKIVDNDTAPWTPPSGGGGGGGIVPITPKPAPTPTPTPLTPPVKPKPVVRALQGRLLSAKIIDMVEGRRRAAIRVSLGQPVSAKVVMLQGKRKITSSPFQLKAGNRTVYVLLPAFAKTGKVQLQLLLTTATGSAKTLKTTIDLKQPLVKKPPVKKPLVKKP